ncbi:hypothetical protein LWI29_000490 [Acer saccharum]|uniref:Polygalacturonase n=1 Tax=Acer saccharum TaxID=4024 RepID=A0AA39TGZ5_ACESA|nr:hypothetical protein LWI29_000490 [Acer saccharum]
MELFRGVLLIWVSVMFSIQINSSNVHGRYHYHKKQNSKGSSVPSSPVSAPEVAPPLVPSTPSNSPYVPSNPYPNDPTNTTKSEYIFDVTNYGAIGDGYTDDTTAFREAWKAACAVESATVLAPSDKTFIITSTIFSGPCQPGLVLQVDGILMPPDGPESWPEADSHKQWLVFYRLDDMTFTGRGDDCISIGTGCSNVDIDGVTCGPSHGISIGSLGVHNSQACVSNITVRNAVIRESDNGLRIKTWQGGTGSVSDISFENIQMENVRNCINIDQYYCLSRACRNQTSAVYVTGITYRTIKGTYDVLTPPIHFACSDTVACTNITMSEVELLPHEGELIDDPFCWNAFGTQETMTIPPINCLQEGKPEKLVEVSQFGC